MGIETACRRRAVRALPAALLALSGLIGAAAAQESAAPDISTPDAAFRYYCSLMVASNWDTLFDYLSDGSRTELRQAQEQIAAALEAGNNPPQPGVAEVAQETGAATGSAMRALDARAFFRGYMQFVVTFLRSLETDTGQPIPGPHRAAEFRFVRAEDGENGQVAAFYTIAGEEEAGLLIEHDMALHRTERGYLFGP